MRGLWRRPREHIERDLALFEELVANCSRQAYRVAFRITGNHEDAQDLIQEALFEAYRHFDRFTPGTRFDRWLYRIMTNRHIDRIRRDGKLPPLSLDHSEDGESADSGWELPDREGDPAAHVLDEVLDERLEKALAELPPEYRQVVVLADIEELSYEEVAHTVRCPVGTVRSRLHRGRALLREKLKHLFPAEGTP